MLYSGRFQPFRQTSGQDGKACKGSEKHSSVLQNFQIMEEKSFTTLCHDATKCFTKEYELSPVEQKAGMFVPNKY